MYRLENDCRAFLEMRNITFICWLLVEFICLHLIEYNNWTNLFDFVHSISNPFDWLYTFNEGIGLGLATKISPKEKILMFYTRIIVLFLLPLSSILIPFSSFYFYFSFYVFFYFRKVVVTNTFFSILLR